MPSMYFCSPFIKENKQKKLILAYKLMQLLSFSHTFVSEDVTPMTMFSHPFEWKVTKNHHKLFMITANDFLSANMDHELEY